MANGAARTESIDEANEAGRLITSDQDVRAVTRPGTSARDLRAEPAGGRRPLRRGDLLAERYEIGARLGQGAVGRVYRAYDRAARMEVAVKVVRPELTGQRSCIDRLGSEVHHARQIQHPNLCRLFELGEADGYTYLTMELAVGSLRGELRARTARTFAERLADARAIAAGLAALHDAGLVHRDLKPENILRLADGRLALSDFGLTVRPGSGASPPAGTRGYFAPEAAKRAPSSPCFDVWALGVVLHEVLFGRRPPASAPTREPWGRPGSARSAARAWVPGRREEGAAVRALRALCFQCLVPEGDRPENARAILKTLDEWDGETLEERLRSGPLEGSQALRLGHAVLDALVPLHRQNNVHGFITPASIFVSSTGSVRLLGSASTAAGRERTPEAKTRAPEYLAPEQARDERGIDGRADVFSLGCVLVECLTGHPPAPGASAVDRLARRAMGEAIDVRGALAAMPEAVRDLLARMLTADPAGRPGDAAALAVEFSAAMDSVVPAAGADSKSSDVATAVGVFAAEQRRTTLVVACPKIGGVPADLGALSKIATSCGARLDRSRPDRLVAVVVEGDAPTDRAGTAATCALRMLPLLPGWAFALGTGSVAVDIEQTQGEAADRADALASAGDPGLIRVDRATAQVLPTWFRLSEGPVRILLDEAREERPRTLLGKQIPCVGRDREIAWLAGLFDQCARDRAAQAVLVTAPAGAGKTRVRIELLDRLRTAAAPWLMLLGRGESLRAGAPFGMIAPALRAAAGIEGDQDPAVQRERLRAFVARNVAVEARERVTAFIGEIASIRFDDSTLSALEAARRDPRLMADQTLDAWLTLMEAETAAQPVGLVLEDLHWGDAPSVQLVDAALRTLAERPFLVLAFGRPEVDTRFPGLWSERRMRRFALPPLRRTACRALVRHALGDRASKLADGIADRADGNPLAMEELTRAAAESAGHNGLPDTVVGMAQARFDGFGPETKRVLRAASLFGESFTAASVEAVLEDKSTIKHELARLAEGEVVYPLRGTSAGAFAFRHALLQEAAYAMVTSTDRRLGHRRAAAWLETSGDADPIVLVEHHERACDLPKAAHWCRIAAEHALEANDVGAVIERVERGVRCGGQGETLGHLRLLEAQARFWRGEYVQAEHAAREAVTNTSRSARLQSMGELIAALGQQAKYDDVHRLIQEVLQSPADSDQRPAWLGCLIRAAEYLLPGGRYEPAERLLLVLESQSDELRPAQRGRLENLRGWIALIAGQNERSLVCHDSALQTFEALGDARNAAEMLGNTAAALAELGSYEESEQRSEKALATAERLDLRFVIPMALANLGLALGELGRFDEAGIKCDRAKSLARIQGDRRAEAVAENILAITARLAGRSADAIRHAEASVDIARTNGVVPLLPDAMASFAAALLSNGRVAEAIERAVEANSLADESARGEGDEAQIRLVLGECLLAGGDLVGAREAIRRALLRLLERAATIESSERRTSFLSRVRDHARTLALAKELGIAAP